jgi:hypothetical protein
MAPANAQLEAAVALLFAARVYAAADLGLNRSVAALLGWGAPEFFHCFMIYNIVSS